MRDITNNVPCEGVFIPHEVTLWSIAARGFLGGLPGGQVKVFILTESDRHIPNPMSAMQNLGYDDGYEVISIENLGATSLNFTKEIHPAITSSGGCHNQTSCPVSAQDAKAIANMIMWRRDPVGFSDTVDDSRSDGQIASDLRGIKELIDRVEGRLDTGEGQHFDSFDCDMAQLAWSIQCMNSRLTHWDRRKEREAREYQEKHYPNEMRKHAS